MLGVRNVDAVEKYLAQVRGTSLDRSYLADSTNSFFLEESTERSLYVELSHLPCWRHVDKDRSIQGTNIQRQRLIPKINNRKYIAPEVHLAIAI